MKTILLGLALTTSLIFAEAKKPNIMLIMADDMGYECLSSNGSESYKTPNLDTIAAQGVRFTNCFANPICTPSRVKIMTGMSNVRNYVEFGKLDRNQKTFAHYLKDAGYKTCIVGKWQLGKEADSPQHFGFEESFLWQHTRSARRKDTGIDSRHVNPRFENNGVDKDFDNGEFSTDLCVDFIDKFITKHKEEAWLVYYPMVLPHCPFIPTPSSPDYDPKSLGSPTYKGDAKYFKNMVEYVDFAVGKLEKRLIELSLADNTILIFVGDNGTDKPVETQWNGKTIAGDKGKMTDAGMRVPMIIKFPAKANKGLVTNQVVDFADLLPTFCELAGIDLPSNTDGASLLPIISGQERERDAIYVWYNRNSGTQKKSTVMARTQTHQLHRKGPTGKLILSNCSEAFALKEISPKDFTENDKAAYTQLSKIISKKDTLHGSELKAHKK